MSIQLTQIEANLLYPPQGSPIESSAKKLQLLIPSHLNLFKFQKNVRNPFSFSRYRNFCHRKKICSQFWALKNLGLKQKFNNNWHCSRLFIEKWCTCAILGPSQQTFLQLIKQKLSALFNPPEPFFALNNQETILTLKHFR